MYVILLFVMILLFLIKLNIVDKDKNFEAILSALFSLVS